MDVCVHVDIYIYMASFFKINHDSLKNDPCCCLGLYLPNTKTLCDHVIFHQVFTRKIGFKTIAQNCNLLFCTQSSRQQSLEICRTERSNMTGFVPGPSAGVRSACSSSSRRTWTRHRPMIQCTDTRRETQQRRQQSTQLQSGKLHLPHVNISPHVK